MSSVLGRGLAYLEEVLDAVGNARHFIGICVGVWGFKSDKVN
jgi:biotin synthase-related radical SAM superfamily protein